MKKSLLGILFIFYSCFAFSQGLEDIIVEKIPVSAEAVAADQSLSGCTAYRVFVDMAPGFEMQGVYGDSKHELFFQTSTSFYNNENGSTAGRQMPSFVFNDAAGRFDSYITIDGVTSTRVGILKSEDTDGNADGYSSGTSLALQTIGADFDTPFGSAGFSGKFSVNGGAYNVNGGESGLTANNRVLIGQFTTNGDFSFSLNVQIRSTNGGPVEKYVANNPVNLELIFPKLSYSTTGATPPVINMIAPASGSSFKIDASVSLIASASDPDGDVTLVEFLLDGTRIAYDETAPYEYNWLAANGSHQLTARATDNSGNQTISSPVSVNVTNTVAPSVNITSPFEGSTFTAGNPVLISATATDADGTIVKVEFFRNGEKIGEDAAAPYQINWSAIAGSAQITAVATDNENNHTTSSAVSITITSTQSGPPSITITSPVNDTEINTGTTVAIEANAVDAGGSVTLVEFFINGSKIGEDANAPYQFNWVATSGMISLTAKATDNDGNKTLSSIIALTVADNFPPLVRVSSPAEGASFSAGTKVSITVVASDKDGSIAKVVFYVNGNKLGEDTSDPFGMEWNSTAGSAEIIAIATDNHGKKTTSEPVTIQVSDTPGSAPVVNLTSPVSGSIFNSGDQIAISANATDADGNVTMVEFLVNGSKIGEDNASPYSYSWIGAAGDISLTARATDNNGKQTLSSAVMIKVNAGTNDKDTLVFDFSKAVIKNNHYQLPVSVISPGDVGSFSLSTVINTTKIAFHQVINHTATLNTTDSFDPISKKLTIGATSQQNINKNTPLVSISFTLVTGAITPADLTQFKAFINGNECKVKLILTAVAIVPPTVSISSPSEGSVFKTGQIIPITATAFDADGTVTLVEFYSNSNKIGEDASSPYQVNFTGVGGVSQLSACATDDKGNQTTSMPVSITITGSDNQSPLVSITNPNNNSEFSAGTIIPVSCSASDTDGTIAFVEFFVNDSLIGKIKNVPYQINYTARAGATVIKAVATDNQGAKSSPATINIVVNMLPTVKITSPAAGESFTAGQTITFFADAQMGGGSIVLIEFFVNGVKVGQDDSSPYQYRWTSVPGQASITAMVTDSKGAKTTSAVVNVSVNAPPIVSIMIPADGSTWLNGDAIDIEAAVSDPDGSISLVEFFINGNEVERDSQSPYRFTWNAVTGIANITATATDNLGAKTTSEPFTIEVINVYEIKTTMNPCTSDNICIPLEAVYPVEDVIGFDVKIGYNPAKVEPSGKVTIDDDLINPAYCGYAVNISVGTLTISVYLNSTAPEGTCFSGTGQLLCAEFLRKDAFQPVDTVEFSVASLVESYFTRVVSRKAGSGNNISYKDYTFAGSLKYWSDESPIPYNVNKPSQFLKTEIHGANPSDCTSNSGVVTYPDESGLFRYDIRNGKALTFNRDIPADSEVQSAINGMDAQLALKMALGDNAFIPSVFQLMASDVNIDGVVSSGDVSQINQRSILMIKEFKQAWNYNDHGVKVIDKPSKDWIFLSSKIAGSDAMYTVSTQYPESDNKGFDKQNIPEIPACHEISISNLEGCPGIESDTFMGIMLGDVNGNYGTLPADGKLKSSFAGEEMVVFDMSHAIRSGNELEIPVFINSDYTVSALDFQFRFSDDKLEFDTIINHTGYIEPTFYLNENDSTLRFTSYSLLNYQKNTNLISVRFNVLQDNISNQDFFRVKTWINGDSVAYQITEYTPIVGITDNTFIPDIKIYPNPAKQVVWVEISDEATLEIIDLRGNTLLEKNKLKANQKQEINIEQLTNGLYFLRFIKNNHMMIRKLVISR